MLNKITGATLAVRAQSTTTTTTTAVGGPFATKAARTKRVLQRLEDIKSDNVKRAAAVFGDIGRKDVEFFKSLHEDLVHLSKSALEEHREWAEAVRHDRSRPSSARTNNGAPLHPEAKAPSEDEDSIFDN